jgi:hypothetical protein
MAGKGPFLSLESLGHGLAQSTAGGIGSDLTVQDLADLEARWTTGWRFRLGSRESILSSAARSSVERAVITPGSPSRTSTRASIGSANTDCAGLEYDSGGNLKPRQKYLGPPGRSNMLYVVPGIDPGLLGDVSIPVVATEGEFKTLALWRLANHGSPAKPRFLPLGLSGVYNWRGTIGKTVGPDGSRLDVKGVIPDLDWIDWQGRKVVIAYDADAVTKDAVRLARSELTAHLRFKDRVPRQFNTHAVASAAHGIQAVG